jgi:RNA polymerase I-specific transcription initiation factor RRN7
LPSPLPAEPWLYAQEQERTRTSRDASETTLAPTPGQLQEDTSDDDDDDEHGGRGDDTHLEDLLREVSELEDSDPDGDGDPADAALKKSIPSRITRKRRNRYEVPASNLAILALGCWTLRVPIIYMDLIRCVLPRPNSERRLIRRSQNRLLESYTLPYFEPLKHLPQEMTRHLTKHIIQALTPRVGPSLIFYASHFADILFDLTAPS